MAKLRLNKKRLSIDLPIGIYLAVKENAKLRNIKITQWLIGAILMRYNQEKKYE